MAFGLDIGTQSIKIIQLEKHADGNFSILAAGITPTPGSGMSSDADQDIQAVAQTVTKLLNDTKASTHRVNITLPESLVFTRLVRFPYLNDKELESAIAWQSEPHIPIPVSEASIDYQVVRRVMPKDGEGGYVDVLLVAAPKHLVEKYVRMAALARLHVVSIESELLAITRALSPDQNTVLVDIGLSSTKIGVSMKDQLVLSRSLNTAGRVLTRAVAQGLGVTVKQGEEYKKTYGLLPDQLEGNVRNVLEPPIRIIVDEIKKTIQYYKSDIQSDDNEPISQILVTGGTAGLPDIIPFLTEAIGLEVGVGDPFARMIKDERVTQSFTNYAPLYTVAVGAALGED